MTSDTILDSHDHRGSVSSFHQLHASGCFVIPNPWDVGSARLLAHLGFQALATASSGFAWSLGRPDNHVSLDEALSHFRSLADSVDVPISADFEGGFAIDPPAVALWQVHFSLLTGQEYTVPGLFIANGVDEQPATLPIRAMTPPSPGPSATPDITFRGAAR